jgi:uncharacterized protein with ParB-like and HNH nuclease domain
MITPSKETIEGILKGSDVTFSVPVYQRNFNWGTSELQELMDDLRETAESENKELFLGNFIFDSSEKSSHKIVDGQQRLTTISILLIALRQQAKEINENEFAGELQGLISVSSSWGEKKGNKINVSENIKDIFEYMAKIDWKGDFPEKIGTQSVKKQVKKIRPIYNFILDQLLEYNQENLRNFTRALLLQSYVIVLKVDNTEDVFSIFERTNARGLDLNIGDLLKNYIFAQGIEEFEYKWEEIIANAESSLQRMLKYFWISRMGYAQQSHLYKNLKVYEKSLGIQKFIAELEAFSRYYKIVQSQDADDVKDWFEEIGLSEISTNEDYYNRINRVFQALKLFRVTQAYPLIFSILEYYKRSSDKSMPNLFRVLESIESYHFVNNVVSGRIGNKVEKFYALKAKSFHTQTKDFSAQMIIFINELNKIKVKREEFVTSFIESITYDNKNNSLIHYVFDRINNKDTSGAQRIDLFYPEKNLKKGNYDVEHFLPQSYKTKDEFLQESQAIFDQIGNLLIIPRHTNGKLQAKTPEEKINIVKSDPKYFGNLRYLNEFLERYQDDFKHWDRDRIEKRSKDIAQLAYEKIWNF